MTGIKYLFGVNFHLTMVRRIVVFGLIMLSVSSCATLLNGPTTKIEIQTDKPGGIIYGADTFHTNLAKRVILRPKRSADPLVIGVFDNTSYAETSVPAINSFAYLLNIPYNSGLGMLADKNDPKRYTYPRKIRVSTEGVLLQYDEYDHRKNDLDLHVSIPYINHFLLRPGEGPSEREKSSTGFLGLSAGLDYYLSPRRSLNLQVAAVTDFDYPLPIPYELEGEYEIFSSVFFGLAHTHKIHRLSLGYGLSYALNIWDLRYYERSGAPPPTRPPVKRQSQAIGLFFPAYFQVGQYFNIGLTYRPTLYRVDTTPAFEYEHLVSLELIGKVKLR